MWRYSNTFILKFFFNGNRKECEREERRKRSEMWQAIERAICEQH